VVHARMARRASPVYLRASKHLTRRCCTCIYKFIYIHASICISIYMYKCVYICRYECVAGISSREQALDSPLLYLYIYVYIYMYMQVYMYVHMCTYVYIYVDTRASPVDFRASKHLTRRCCTCIYIYISIYIYICIYIYIYVYVCIYI